MESIFKSFDDALKESSLFPLTAKRISVLQINMGRLCNLACRHCHVDAGPARKEIMSKETLEACLEVIKAHGIPVADLTGGAPEMNPDYMQFVKSCVDAGCRVKTRTNLSILTEDGYTDLPSFFAENKIEVIASLPYFLEETTDRQRGKGVFASSIEALKNLNSIGYGVEGSGLELNLVFNPCGAFLPPQQKAIEADFKRELKKRYGVSFSSLYTITNMPVGRFLDFLKQSGNLRGYMEKLQSSYNPSAASNVMCGETLSVGWDGSLYDCDFNQMAGLKCGPGSPIHIKHFDRLKLESRRIVTGAHCFGCTAGAGSSCTGAVS
ncbi:MAG: arsenosugar biosynthesis radical SAM protein ArsS [Deltaproteobacteria bacterium]|nr:arsenosugar biosynthesis radical SAM protein ArsS [Deltaproteobacteria bacterium]